MKRNKTTLRRLLSVIGRHWPLLLLSLLLSSFAVILQLYVPVLFGAAIDCIIGLWQVDFSAMKQYLLWVMILIVSSGLLTWLVTALNNRVTYTIVHELRTRAMHRLQRLPLSYLDAHSSGDLVSRIISDTDTLSDGLLLGFSQLFSGVVTIVFTLIFMFSLNVKISLIVVLLTPMSFFIARFISSRAYRLFHRQSELRGEQTALIDELVGNQKVVKLFGYESRASERFAAVNRELIDTGKSAVFFGSLTNPSTRFVNNLVYACVALVGVLMIPSSLTVGGLSVLLSYSSQYMKPFNDISSVIAELQNALACASRVFALLDEAEESPDGDRSLGTVRGEVTLRDVSFSYDKTRPLISQLDLAARPGMRIAIVGPTGCGKTTLINLLMRFYDVDGGEIRIDDVPIEELSRHALRSGFGMVLQDTWIKNDTVRENIRFGKPDATDDEIIEAARLSHCLSFIRRLPNGLDTVLTADSLSQGQRQLLCIARVMLCRPPMLILDEATSNIDTRTELKIQAAFDTLMENRTAFIVAHRLSTIRDASLILVMRDGKIVEKGTHEQLLADGGLYHQLYYSQFRPTTEE